MGARSIQFTTKYVYSNSILEDFGLHQTSIITTCMITLVNQAWFYIEKPLTAYRKLQTYNYLTAGLITRIHIYKVPNKA